MDLDGTNLGIVPFLAEEEDAGGEVREGGVGGCGDQLLLLPALGCSFFRPARAFFWFGRLRPDLSERPR